MLNPKMCRVRTECKNLREIGEMALKVRVFGGKARRPKFKCSEHT